MSVEAMIVLWRTFPQAVVAGLVIAATCALIGTFVILKRVVFIGITLSEVAACGIAAAMVCGVHPFVGAGMATLAVVALLSYPFETGRIPRDAVLGVVFVLAAAMSILLVSKSGFGLHEVKSLLYGDLILTSPSDLKLILGTLLPVLVYMVAFLRPTFYTFLDRDAAKVLGIRVVLWEMLYFAALGLAVSAASKVAGALLSFCYLVVAPSAALLISGRLWVALATGVAVAMFSTLGGLAWSMSRDLPTNQTIAVVTCAWFVLALLAGATRRIVRRLRP